jgi:hypothetical protein
MILQYFLSAIFDVVSNTKVVKTGKLARIIFLLLHGQPLPFHV